MAAYPTSDRRRDDRCARGLLLVAGAVSGFLLVVAFESTRALDRSSATIQRSSTRSLAVLLKKRTRTSLSSDRSRSQRKGLSFPPKGSPDSLIATQAINSRTQMRHKKRECSNKI